MKRLIFLLLFLIISCSDNKQTTFQIDSTGHTHQFLIDTLINNKLKANNLDSNHKTLSILSKDGKEALEWKLQLIAMADSSIEIQTFLWDNTISGSILIDRIIKKANRGIYVKILVDDLGLDEFDFLRELLDSHPFISIKSFNPTTSRNYLKYINLVLNNATLNHRMHNKLFIIDNKVAIVGGRNIGDNYFSMSEKYNFIDHEVLVTGDVLPEISKSFKVYWNSPWSKTPSEHNPSTLDKIRSMKSLMERREVNTETAFENFKVKHLPDTNYFDSIVHRVTFSYAKMIYDDPLKLKDGKMDQTIKEIGFLVELSHKEILISTPYLWMSDKDINAIKQLIDKGVKVKILTNSLVTTNHAIAHSAYIKVREKFIMIGVELYELKRRVHSFQRWDITGKNRPIGLHSKFVVIDNTHSYIGSLNLVARAIINSECGLLLESETFASELSDEFNYLTHSNNSWRVTMNHSHLIWGDGIDTLSTEPDATVWRRLYAKFFSLFPIEKQL